MKKYLTISITFMYLISILFLFGFVWTINTFGVYHETSITEIFIPLNILQLNYIFSFILKCLIPASLCCIFFFMLFKKYYQKDFFIKFYILKFNKIIDLTIKKPMKMIFIFLPYILTYFILSYIMEERSYLDFIIDRARGFFIIKAVDGLSITNINYQKILLQSFITTIALQIIYYICSPRIEIEENKLNIIKFKKVLNYIFVLIAVLVYTSTNWIVSNFGRVTPDQLLFQISVPIKGANNDYVKTFILKSLIPAVIISLIIYFIVEVIKSKKFRFYIGFNKKQFSLLFLGNKLKFAYILLLIFSVFIFNKRLNIVQYFMNSNLEPKFIDHNYIDPKDVKLTFPEKKKNLIYIFMESMETTYTSRELGGVNEQNYIPELTELAMQNINFSNSDKLGGATQSSYTGWTIGGMVSQHSGIPLKIPIDGNSYGMYESFLPGATTLGDILDKEGYNQSLIVGSDSEFGGRKSYYTQHGNYKVLDLFTAPRDNIIPNGYYVWWGYEDQKLYKYARKELLELSKEDKPFNLTMLTVDTHATGGYKCDLCEDKFDEQYWNIANCASHQLSEFIDWIKQQDFYEDTTIVIAGDHLSMDAMVANKTPEGYERTTLNIFINASAEPKNINNRMFSTMDMFPTTLASMGVKIDGDKLALGTNLFSDEKTILELNGVEKVERGLKSSSKIYDSLLHQK